MIPENKSLLRSYSIVKRAFSLLELSIVILIISILSLVTIPSVSNYLKQNTALSELKSNLELARSLAIKKGINSYVAFVDDDINNNAYTLYSIFLPEDDFRRANSTDENLHNIPVRMYQKWVALPKGVIFALGEDFKTYNGDPIFTILDLDDKLKRSFPASGVGDRGGSNLLHFFAFNKDGNLVHPTREFANYSNIGLIRGYYESTTKERIIYRKDKDNSLLNPANDKKDHLLGDLLQVNIYSGRVRHAN